ncbi:hypothetical protein Goshw_025497 [Gossypium schwendimanii]|uniref:Uncharacterized protein n=1 Tax=Gossypium schwendimanii TaxID=34291 RepID=A0A7J9NEI9_GOSSC|nr:hypothetical protein [Gossypium schwendimanii]
MKVDKYLFRALVQFWNPAYSCFTFGKDSSRQNLLKSSKCTDLFERTQM